MQCSHRKVPSMSGITVVAVAGLTNVAVEGSCWFRCRFGCRLWCWFRCRLGWCWFWRRAWAWLHRGVVDLKLVAAIPTTRADSHLKIKMPSKKELVVKYLLRWVVIGVNVNAHNTSYRGLWQVQFGGVFETETFSTD